MKNQRLPIFLCLFVLLFSILLGCSDEDPGIEPNEKTEESGENTEEPNENTENELIPFENITSEVFKRYLLEQFDEDKDRTISVVEAEAVTTMSFPTYYGLSSLEGIEYFTNLKVLHIPEGNLIDSLDLSKNIKLEELLCKEQMITSLNLTDNISLKTLDCSNNAGLTSLDLSKCTALESLNCLGCDIAELDLKYCTSLKFLHSNGNEQISCADNIILDKFSISRSQKMSSLDISNIPVAKFDCSHSSIVSLDASNNLNLKEIYGDNASLLSLTAEGSGIESISLEGCDRLVLLNLKNCTNLVNLQYHVSSRYGLVNEGKVDLDISGCTMLTGLDINYLNTLNATGCTSLKKLNCYGQVTDAIVKECSSLETLKFDGAELKRLDIGDCSALKVLSCCGGGTFTSLDLSSNPLLDSLTCYAPLMEFNAGSLQKLRYLQFATRTLSSLDISQCSMLEELRLSYEYYHRGLGDEAVCHINASGCLSLRKIDCGNANNIKSINADGCINLENFIMDDNLTYNFHIETLSLKRCSSLKKIALSNLILLTSLDLNDCVSLESVSIEYTRLESLKPNKNVKFLTCSYNKQLVFLDTEGLHVLESLDCANNNIHSLNLDQCISLRELYCSNNNIDNLDLDQCRSLRVLHCSNNNINNLDLDQCTSLKTLLCSVNNITSLSIESCNQLETIYCDNNKLSGTLNVGNCKSLKTLKCNGNPDLTKLIVYRNHIISSLDKDSHMILELGN